jgi:hypothetical protein
VTAPGVIERGLRQRARVLQTGMAGDQHPSGSFRICAAAFVTASLVTLACPVDRSTPTTSSRCQPSGEAPQYPEEYVCCSDDPAALELANLDADSLPAYEGRGGSGVPLFSGTRNFASESGMCVHQGSVPPAGALTEAVVQGCPIPCNPSWSNEDLAVVCGPDTLCCQTVELDVADCVLDPALGSSGCWRPAHGGDIEGLGGLEATGWTAAEHVTLQDPGGLDCQKFVAGLTDDLLDTFAVERDAVMRACLRRLSVADQRGFCLGGANDNSCPFAQSSYRDACEQRNDAEARVGCG